MRSCYTTYLGYLGWYEKSDGIYLCHVDQGSQDNQPGHKVFAK